MSSLLITFLAACILVALAVFGLGLGYFLTGKSKYIYRKCGYRKEETKEKKKKDKCDFCGK